MKKTSEIESEMSKMNEYSSCYVHYGIEELREKIQPAYLKILLDFDQICRENDITYAIVAGALLGAARNGKFIPWDDDIDVVVKGKDYFRIKDALNSLQNI